MKDIKAQFCKTSPAYSIHGFIIIFLLVTVFSCLSYSSYSQEKGLPFIQNYSPYEYQSHRQNWAVVQAKNGIMYFANGKGVLEFDGVSWRLIMLPNRGHVRSLALGDDGTIYVGGNGDFGYLAPDEKGLLQFVSLLSGIPENALGFGRVWTILETGQGVFFQSYNHLFRFRNGNVKIWHFEKRLHRIFAFDDVIYGASMGVGLIILEGDDFKEVPGGSAVKDYHVDIMLRAKEDKILVGTRLNGFFIFDGKAVVTYDIPANDTLRSLGMYKAVYLPEGHIAVASNFRGGIIIVDKNTGEVRQFINETTGIAINNVLNLFVDRQNALWVGMQEGIARVELSTMFSVFDKRLGLDGTIQDIIRYNGTIFAATSGGLYALEQDTNGNNRFVPVQDADYYVWRLQPFGDQLLIGTTYGTYTYRQGKVSMIKYYHATTADFYPSAFEENTIWQAIDVGLAAIKWEKGRWVEKGEITGISGAVRGIIEVDRGELWLRTRSNGVFQVIIPVKNDSTPDFSNADVKHFNHTLGIPIGENILYLIHGEIYNRSEDNLLSRFDRSTGRFVSAEAFAKKFGINEGQALPKQNAGEKEHIWLDHYASQDRNQSLVYASCQPGRNYEVKSYKTGKILNRFHDLYNPEVFYGEENLAWIGGMNGIVLMKLNSAWKHDDEYEVHIRRISNSQDSLLLMGSHFEGGAINFAHKNNALRIEYAAPYYQKEGQNQYQCMLEGFDRQWSVWTTETKKNYTNLWEGNYNFKVKARNSYGHISDVASFQFSISPPWYRSWWAYATYTFGLIALVAVIVKWRSAQLQREKMQLEKVVWERTDEVRRQADKLKELDIMKSRFFANISHEFRTPLTLILTPLKKLLATKIIQKEATATIGLNTAKLMERNAERLLRLINQLLDLSKLEAGNMVLEVKHSDVLQFIRSIAHSFSSLAEYKKIDYRIQVSSQKLQAYFDPETIEKIISNLLSNAFKFTEENGKISLRLLIDDQPVVDRQDRAYRIKIIVKDSGKGIPHSLKNRIFERFYQVDDSHTREQEGSGIGLALTRELVELHHGTIMVESEEGKGTKFTVCLPIDKSSFSPEELSEAEDTIPSLTNQVVKATMMESTPEEMDLKEEVKKDYSESGEKPRILLVEDSGDFRFFIKDNLKEDYVVSEAINGKKGLEIALDIMPDLIITDLMMPKMDGIELCKAVKTNKITSHIPVIMLTARSNVEARLEGLQTGADDYITKPFNIDELVVRCNNLITQREKLRERFGRDVNFEPKEVAVSSLDEKFLEKVLFLMEENLANPEFGVPAMQMEAGMSKTQLHRKLKALTDQSPGEFMRNFRLKRAAQILSGQGGNVTEVSYQVGFNNLSYFAKCFKDLFGVSPSEYVASHSGSGTKT